MSVHSIEVQRAKRLARLWDAYLAQLAIVQKWLDAEEEREA